MNQPPRMMNDIYI